VARIGPAAKVIWLTLSLTVLIASLYFDMQSSHHDDQHRGVLLTWGMLILSFPSGLLIPYLFVGFGYLLLLFGMKPEATSGYYEALVFPVIWWFSFLVVGYLQWFKLVPHLVIKFLRPKD